MQVSTDSMKFFNKKKAEEERKKRLAEEAAERKADQEMAVKLKGELWFLK